MDLVALDQIPSGEYNTPKDNLMKLYAVAQQMEAVCVAKNGMGLSASQVGLPWKFFVYWSNFPKNPKKFDYFLDCEYAPKGEKFLSLEGCLSLGNKRFQLERYESVIVSGKRLTVNNDSVSLEDFKSEFNGIPAVVMQHEIDHNYGREKMIDTIGKQIYLS